MAFKIENYYYKKYLYKPFLMPLKLYLKKHILQLKIVNIVDKFNEYSPASAGS